MAFDHASMVGQEVYWEHGDRPEVPYFVSAYLGDSDVSGHLYRLTRDGMDTIIGADLLSVMTHDGLVGLDNRTEGDYARESDALDSPGIPHPFEQVGKAGAAPVASVKSGGETAVPAFGYDATDMRDFEDFLRWKRSRPADPGDMQTVRPLSPEESKVADTGAIESPSWVAERNLVRVPKGADPYPVRGEVESDDDYHARVRAWEVAENARASGAQGSDETDVSEHQV